MVRRLAILAALCGTALADDGTTPLALTVGVTARRDVGYARGVRCDDTAIVAAEISTDTARDTNVVAFTGLKAGRTLCRVGLEVGRPVIVFELAVSAKPSPRR